MQLLAGLSRDFYANLVFCIYALGILSLDVANFDSSVNNVSYVFLGGLHLGSAWMYRCAWVGRAWSDPVVFPEITNIFAAILYLCSAALYHRIDGTADAPAMLVNSIEVTAAIMDLIACLGWAITWHLTYPRFSGRGYTPRDLDIWALLASLAGAGIYVFYNFQKLIQSDYHVTSRLYFFADISYVCAGLLYLVVSLRHEQGLELEILIGKSHAPIGKLDKNKVLLRADWRLAGKKFLGAGRCADFS